MEQNFTHCSISVGFLLLHSGNRVITCHGIYLAVLVLSRPLLLYVDLYHLISVVIALLWLSLLYSGCNCPVLVDCRLNLGYYRAILLATISDDPSRDLMAFI